MPESLAKRHAEKVSRYDDIRSEFEYWIQSGDYPVENPLTIEEYSAKGIYTLAPSLNGLGVFNFMVTLREAPDKAKSYIKEGFKVR
jgi:hypothetical protein